MLRLFIVAAVVLALPAEARDRLSADQPGSWRTTVSLAAKPQPGTAKQANPIVTSALPRPGTEHALRGIASYYWQDQMTSSGERFNRHDLTAAHKTLPMGTRVKVTHQASGRSVVVRINDRGPFKPGRVIDLSEAAAREIGMTAQGLAFVAIEVVR